MTAPSGEPMTFRYDASHRMTSKTDARGTRTDYLFSDKGEVTEIHHATGETDTLQSFLSAGVLPAGVVANPDDTLNPVAVVQNTPQKWTDGKGGITKSLLDEQGLETEVVDPLSRVTKIARNPAHLPTAITRPDLSLLGLAYDANGSMTRTQIFSPNRALVSSSAFTYEPIFHQITSVTDPNNKKTFFEYDARGNLIKITNPLNQVTRAAYNAAGLATSVTDALGKVTSFSYDGRGKYHDL